MLKITFSAEDALALYTGIGSNDVQLPKRSISRADFPACPDEVVGQPVPILYGDLREATGTTLAAPTLVANYTRGQIWAGAFEITDEGRRTGWAGTQWIAGYGLVTGGPDALTNVTLADAAGGTIDQVNVIWNARLYAMAVAVNPAGVASSPFPAWAATVQGATYTGVSAVYDDFAADDRIMNVTITWPAAATTGWTARVYLGWNYYGIRWDQVRTLSHPSTVAAFDAFNMGPPLGTGRELSTGASYVTYTPPAGIYTVRAYDANGESPDSETLVQWGQPEKLPHYVEWSAVAGATGYRLYQWATHILTDAGFVATGAPLRYWDVGAATTWTGYPEGDGSIAIESVATPARGVSVRHVGQLSDDNGATWEAFLVAGHACQTISGAYLNSVPVPSAEYGTDIALPGQTGFAAAFATVYRDINSHRYTLVYLRGTLASRVLQDGEVLTVDVAGIEDVGDGSGALITDLFEQYEHWLRNLVLRDYQTGAWSTSGPTWGDTPYDVDLIDGASFLAAKAIADTRISGGYTGAFGIGLDDFGTVREWVARLNQSADCYCGFSRKSQFVVKLLHATQALVDAAPVYSDNLGILRDTFTIDDDVLMIENHVTGQYDHNWADGSWRRGVTLEDVDAQVAVGEVRPYDLNLYCVRNAAQAWDITNRRLTRRKFPYRIVSFESDMGALTIDLGDLVRITHLDGLGASGWTDRAAMVVRHEFDPNRFVVALDCLDVDYLVNPITEDASWLPTVALGAEGGAFVTWSEDLGLLGSDAVTVTEGKTATAS